VLTLIKKVNMSNASKIRNSASSYGKKYALGNLFLIDDTQDADAINKHDKTQKPIDAKEHTKLYKQVVDALSRWI
jgi:hypothetical protein